MSVMQNKAAIIRAPVALDGTNGFGLWKLDADTAHKASACPAEWSGRIVAFIAVGGSAELAFALNNAAAEVDRSVAATDNGATLKVGLPVADSASAPGMEGAIHLQLPEWNPPDVMYFVREASVDNTVIWAWLASP